MVLWFDPCDIALHCTTCDNSTFLMDLNHLGVFDYAFELRLKELLHVQVCSLLMFATAIVFRF
jgi:hypothetical protein